MMDCMHMHNLLHVVFVYVCWVCALQVKDNMPF